MFFRDVEVIHNDHSIITSCEVNLEENEVFLSSIKIDSGEEEDLNVMEEFSDTDVYVERELNNIGLTTEIHKLLLIQNIKEMLRSYYSDVRAQYRKQA